MTSDRKLITPAQRATKFAVDAQHEQGGWRYRPRQDRDTSVSGCIMMGLHTANLAGVNVPQETLDRFAGYLDAAEDNASGRYAYLPGSATDEVMTAEALLCRKHLGWNQDDRRMRAGAEFLTSPENLPSLQKRDVYYWYYATQTLRQVGGDYWVKWNKEIKPTLLGIQSKDGADAGSWDPIRPTEDRWGLFGGRLYLTCLSICILEAYYRHIPQHELGGPPK